MAQNFSLIICTYMRPQSLCDLLISVEKQTLYPDEILIIDGSTNTLTEDALSKKTFKNLRYYKVDHANRGLTKQRNFGIRHVSKSTDIVCFLDDDTILTEHYFKELLNTYKKHPEALGVGGYIINEIEWKQTDNKKNIDAFYYDGFMRIEPSRFKLRRKLGLQPDTKPGFLPSFSHGRSVGFLPPSGKIYEVEQLMGGVSSFRFGVFNSQMFSPYFEGYGLYEDADFCLRLSKKGKLFINTKAQLYHYHEPSGRPNQFQYGKMVVRNGWYVWRVKYPNPSFKAQFKWHATAFLLTLIRFSNAFTSTKKTEALTESFGRFIGWLSLYYKKPLIYN